jgi:membrane protease YdiL (CAAX protease family)
MRVEQRIPSMIVRLFWNSEERRLSLFLRLAIFAVAILLVLVATRMFAMWVGHSLEATAAVFIVQMALVLLASGMQVRLVDRRPFSELGLFPRRGYFVDFSFGILLGAVCMTTIAGVETMLGWGAYTWRYGDGRELVSSLPSWVSVISIFVSVAIIEEVIFRGYPLHNVCDGLKSSGASRGARVAIATVLTSLVFGVAHAANPNASVMAILFIAFGGIFLASGLLFSGDLAIPIGAHLGWNFFQNCFGMQVSGQQFEAATLFRRDELGPDLATGGAFGPEAGLEGLFAMALGTILTLCWIRVRSGSLVLHPRFGAPNHPPAGREVDDMPRP